MSFANNIPNFVDKFFKSCEIDEKVNNYSFFLIRYDGVVLYYNKKLENDLTKSSIGALLGGVWQAAKALSEFIPSDKKEEGYRLSFDTSSQGIYIVPINSNKEELYLGLIYHDEINPGLIKNKIRDMASSFNEFLDFELKNKAPLKKKERKSDYLFNDISDAEMDKLFSFVKN